MEREGEIESERERGREGERVLMLEMPLGGWWIPARRALVLLCGVICLVNSVNERDLSLLNTYT